MISLDISTKPTMATVATNSQQTVNLQNLDKSTLTKCAETFEDFKGIFEDFIGQKAVQEEQTRTYSLLSAENTDGKEDSASTFSAKTMMAVLPTLVAGAAKTGLSVSDTLSKKEEANNKTLATRITQGMTSDKIKGSLIQAEERMYSGFSTAKTTIGEEGSKIKNQFVKAEKGMQNGISEVATSILKPFNKKK